MEGSLAITEDWSCGHAMRAGRSARHPSGASAGAPLAPRGIMERYRQRQDPIRATEAMVVVIKVIPAGERQS